jgi:uncharacterized protein (DUF362 family)
MSANISSLTRREFVRKTVVGSVGLAAGVRAVTLGGTASASSSNTAKVAVSYGLDRADNAFRALSYFKKQIAAAIGNKRVIIKPNFVVANNSLACTNAAWAEGVLEFLKSIGKTHVAFAECPYNGVAMEGYDYNGYLPLAGKYPVQFLSLSQEGTSQIQVFQNTDDTTPTKTIRVAKLFLNPNNFIISACPMKTHDTGFATLSLKNIAMAAPITDSGYPWNQAGTSRDKLWMHGNSGNTPGNAQALNDNVYWMAANGIHPHLSVIDGYQGMQANGPAGTTPAPNQYVGVVSLDYVAADRIALALMTKSQLAPGSNNTGGIWNTTFVDRTTKQNVTLSTPYPAYLNYCGQMQLGTPGVNTWDINNINVVSLGFGSGNYASAAVDYTPNANILTAPQTGMYSTPPAPPPS